MKLKTDLAFGVWRLAFGVFLLALAPLAHAQTTASRIPLTLDPGGSTISKGFIVPSGQTLTINPGATFNATGATISGLTTLSPQAAITSSAAGTVAVAANTWTPLTLTGTGTYNVGLSTAAVSVGSIADILLTVSSGTSRVFSVYPSPLQTGSPIGTHTNTGAAALGKFEFIYTSGGWVPRGINDVVISPSAAAGGELGGQTTNLEYDFASDLAPSSALASGALASWTSRVGAVTADQATAGNQPAVSASADESNFKGAVFNPDIAGEGADGDYMDLSDATSLTGDFTIMVVAKCTVELQANGEFNVGVFMGNATGSPHLFGLSNQAVDPTVDQLWKLQVTGPGGNSLSAELSGVDIEEYHIYEVVRQSGTCTFRVDGVSFGTDAGASGTISIGRIGAFHNTVPSGLFEARAPRFTLWTTATGITQATARAALASKYGITLP